MGQKSEMGLKFGAFGYNIKAKNTERVKAMKASIDRDGCISCGLCPATCPEVFRMADDGKAEVYVEEVPKDAEVSAVAAMDGCPVQVITVG
jgi:ferredoxin